MEETERHAFWQRHLVESLCKLSADGQPSAPILSEFWDMFVQLWPLIIHSVLVCMF